MAIFGNVFEDEEKKKEDGGGDTFTVSKPTSKIFGDVFVDDGGSEKQQQVDQSTQGLTASTETSEKRGFFAKAVDAGKNVLKFGLDAWNAWQTKKEPSEFETRELMYNTKVTVDPVTGERKIGSDRLDRYKNAKTPEEKQKIIDEQQAEIPLIKMMNSETGKKVISTVSEKTSNIPIKGASDLGLKPTGNLAIDTLQLGAGFLRSVAIPPFSLSKYAEMVGIGDNIYEEAYTAWVAERNDESNGAFSKFMYEIQDTGVQSSIGALLSLGLSYVATPTVGYSVSTAYYTALSADEQLKERGEVDSLGNIAIDVVGDQILNTLLLNIVGGQASGSVLKSALQGFGVEGSTEVSQSLLKYANDYGNARTEAEKQAVLDNAKRYVVDGGMAMEFFVGGTVGGILSGGAQFLSPNVDTAQIEEVRNDIAQSEAFDLERAVESGDVERSAVYQVPEGSVDERIARIQSNPSEVMLYRGQSEDSGGMHFTDDPSWSRNFGEEEIVGKLPKNAKIYTLTEQDLSISADLGVTTDAEMYQRFFNMGYDAVIGTDSRNSSEVDIIVDPEIVSGFSKVDGDSVVKLSPKFAEGRVNDIAQKLGKLSPELETAFRERVDVNNVHSIAELQSVANQLINRAQGGTFNPSSQPNQPTTRPTARQRFIPEVDNADIGKIAEELTQLERTLDPNNEEQAARALNLRDIMNDYVQSFRDRTVFIPSDTTSSPLIKVETASLPNGKFVVRYEANVEGNGTASVYDFSQTFNTKEEATKDALAAITAWAQSQEAGTPEQKVGYEKVLASAKNPRAPIPPQVPKEKTPRDTKTKQKTVKPKDEEPTFTLEAIRNVNPVLLKKAEKATDVEVFIREVVKADKTTREKVDVPSLTKFYERVKRLTNEAKQGQGEEETSETGKVSKTKETDGTEAKKGFTEEIKKEVIKKIKRKLGGTSVTEVSSDEIFAKETPKKKTKASKLKSIYDSMATAMVALEEAGQLEGGIEDIQKFGRASRGVEVSTFENGTKLLAGGYREGILTDGFILIKDRKIAEAEIPRIADKRKAYVAVGSGKNQEPVKWVDVQKLVQTAEFPDITFLFDKEIGEKATVEGYYFDKRHRRTFVSLKSKNKRMSADVDKLAYMVKILPDADIHIGDNGGALMLQFVRDGKAVGFLMGVVKGGNPFEIEKVKLDYKIPKGGDAYIDARTAFGTEGGQPETGGAELPDVMGSIKEINPIEMPELVDIARELSGEVPQIKKKISSSGTLGLHQNGKLKLLASLFEEGNLPMASKVIAHEIGHLIDFMPDRSPNRNRNIIGRLFTLRDFLKQTFNPTDGSSFTSKDRAQVRSEVQQEVMAQRGLKDKKDLTIADKARIKELYKKQVDMILENDGFIKEETLKKELLAATRYWNPYPETAPPSYIQYRESTAELYAEALSMLFNAPNRLKTLAPTFYERFFEALDKKPNVRNVYFEIQALLSGDRELIVKRRREGVKTMFKEGDYKAIELHNRRVDEKEARRKQYWTHFKHTVIDKNFQIIDRVKKAQREGKTINPDENPVFFLEERNYLGGKIKAIFEREFNTVYQTLTENEVSWEDFGEVMFYMRIAAGDRSDVANPRGITPDAARELVKEVVKNYSPAQRTVLMESVTSFQKASRKITEDAFDGGLYKPELYAMMQENPAYVTFQVLDHLEDGMTSRVYKSLGTLKDIANPADSTMLKIISTIRATERNRTTKATVDFLKSEFPEDIEEAKYTGSKKGRFPIPSKDPQKELITVFVKGVMKGYYVDPYIAETINNQTVGANAPIVPAIRFMNSTFFRPLFISFNLGFQSFNLIRDFVRTYKNFSTLSFAKTFQLYAKSGRIARVRAFGKPKNPNAKDLEAIELLNRLEEEKVLSVTYNDIINGHTELDKQVEKILADTGIKEFQPKPRIENVPRFAKPAVALLNKSGLVDVGSSMLGFIENLGNLIETLPKAAGTYFLMEQNQGEFLTTEQQSYIRRKIGSPDFLAGGTYKPITNEVFLFSNAIIQGIRSDIEIATDPKTRSGWWWKTTKVTFLPKLLMFAALLGAFGDDEKELMESASEYDRTSYNIIPLGKDENGKAIYLRVPVDETSRFLGGMFWKVLTMGRNEQTFGADLMNVVSYTGGQIPSVSPAVQSAVATTQYLSGQNPYDWFRGRNVISDTVFQAGGTESLKSFLGWQFQQLGGGIFYRFYHEPTAPKAESNVEKIFNLPVLGNILGRFVRVSDYGKLEELKAVEKRVQKEEARQILKDRALVNKYLTRAQEENIRFNTRALEDEMIKEAFGGLPKTQKDADKADRLVKKLKLGIKRGDSDATVVSLIDANTNAQKIELLKVIREDMTRDEFSTLKRDLIENKIVSVNVFNDLESGN